MTTITIDEIWQAIRESERSDEFQFIDDETSIKAEVARVAPWRRFQADGVMHDSNMAATLKVAMKA